MKALQGGVLCALLGLGACSGPRPQAPEQASIALPASWRDGQSGAAAAAPVPADRWALFGDPQLNRVVAQALAHNSDIASAVARIAELRAQYRLSEEQMQPHGNAQFDGGRQSAPNAFGKQLIQNPRQLQFVSAYDADLFGRLEHSTAAAHASLLASVAARQTVQLTVAASAAGAYLHLQALDARLGILRATLAARGAALQVARRRAGQGYAAQLEPAQAEAEWQATAQQIAPLELAIRRQEHALSVLLGQAPQAIARSAAEAGASAGPVVPAGLPSSLLRRRPDVVQAELQLLAADHSLDAARDAFMPSVRLTVAGGFADSDVLSKPIELFSLGGSVLAPVFERARLQAQADGAAARRDQAAFAYRKAVLTALREVEDALAAIAAAAAQEQQLSAQRDAQARLLAMASQRYRAGYAAYLEQIDAQRGLLAVELSLVQARDEHRQALVALFQSLGGGWQSGG